MPEAIAYRCPCGFEGPVRGEGADQWRHDSVGCFDGDPECEHPAVVCPKCGKWFDLCEEHVYGRRLTHVMSDGTRLEPSHA